MIQRLLHSVTRTAARYLTVRYLLVALTGMIAYSALVQSASAQRAPTQPTLPPPRCNGVAFGAGAVELVGEKIDPASEQPWQLTDSSYLQGGVSQLPPEIARIRNGGYAQWIGGFINDGLAVWMGVDVDAGTTLSIQRRVWDKGSNLAKDFELPPTMVDISGQRVVRSWQAADGSRKVSDEVRFTVLTAKQMTQFVCAANKVWKQTKGEQKLPVMPTDTLSNDATLLLTRANQKNMRYSKAALGDEWLYQMVEKIQADSAAKQ